MSFNLIDKKLVSKNKIILTPEVNFIYATDNCKKLELHGLSSSGKFGTIPSKKKHPNKVKFGENSFTSRIYKVKDKNESANVDFLNESKSVSVGEQEDYYDIISQNYIPDISNEYSFEIKKVRERFLVDDIGYNKKKSIKNLSEFYSRNSEISCENFNWGICNYNTINFFSINSEINDSFSSEANKTHRNFIAYPNPAFGEVGSKENLYNFKDLGEGFTFSFYLNQRRKNKESYSFNPGCILFIPKVIGIYLVKGSNVDISGFTDSFRIYVELGQTTCNVFDYSGVFFSGEDPFDDTLNSQESYKYFSSNTGDYRFLSSDNIIKYNSWQNVCIRFKNSSDGNGNNNSIIDIVVDSEVIDSFTFNSTFFSNFFNGTNNLDSFILIGNRVKHLTNEGSGFSGNPFLGEYYKKLFSSSKIVVNDNVGSYVNKSISFGNKGIDNNYYLSDLHDSQLDYSLNNTLEPADGDYITSDTSYAFSGELHDIRIYSSYIENIRDIVAENSITDFYDEDLIFSLPVYYYDYQVKKRGPVNIYGFTRGDSGDFDEIDTDNLLIDGPVNSYFRNKCFGHDVSIENFLVEFTQKTMPNIVINNNFESDNNVYATFCLLNDDVNTSEVDDLVRQGYSLNYIYNTIISKDYESILPDYLHNSIVYKNNLILPNDNGLQNQKYHLQKNYYKEESFNSKFHINKGFNDFSFINLNSVHSEEICWLPSQGLISTAGNNSLIEETETLSSILDIEDREDFIINDLNYFKDSYDLFYNNSLYNYKNVLFSLSDSYDDERMFSKKSVEQTKFIEVGLNSFFKDMSNPLGRKISDNYNNSIARNLQPVGYKDLDSTSQNRIAYFKKEMPLYSISKDSSERFSFIIDIPTPFKGKKIKRKSIALVDTDLFGTGGALNITLKDNGFGNMYRADCLTKQAEWNSVGHVFYNEGFVSILHPSLENFCDTNFSFTCSTEFEINSIEYNIPAYSGMQNLSRNNTWSEDLRQDSTAYNSDESIVYISNINLHDEDLNIIAKAKLSKPYIKKSSDNVVFRLTMDF